MNNQTISDLRASYAQFANIVENMLLSEAQMGDEFDAAVYGFEHQKMFYKSIKNLRKSIKQLQKGMNDIYEILPEEIQDEIAGI